MDNYTYDVYKKIGLHELIALWKKEIDILQSDDEATSESAHIYGYPFILRWNGYEIDLGDGPLIDNYIIPALEDMLPEWDEMKMG